MNKKNNYDNLYIGFYVYDYEVETEMYVQYETFGTIEHRIIIDPKPQIIYSKIDDNGNELFYDYKTNKQVFINSYKSSFKTKSSPMESLYCGYINRHITLSIPELRNIFLNKHNQKKQTVGYLTPINTYIDEKFGLKIELNSPFIIDKLIKLINLKPNKEFMLSMDLDEAKVQLSKIGYHEQEKKKQI